jgi:hypothetical protein
MGRVILVTLIVVVVVLAIQNVRNVPNLITQGVNNLNSVSCALPNQSTFTSSPGSQSMGVSPFYSVEGTYYWQQNPSVIVTIKSDHTWTDGLVGGSWARDGNKLMVNLMFPPRSDIYQIEMGRLIGAKGDIFIKSQ